MSKNKTLLIADTIHGSIKLNNIEKQIISTQIFNRLHNISQNSTVYLTFPTNRTKRFEHSIGTMFLCGQIFQQSILNADSSTLNHFFSSVEEIINNQIKNHLTKYEKYRSKIGDRNLLYEKIEKYKKSTIIDEYYDFIPVNVKEEYRNLYVLLFQSIRVAALMHDVGHPPFSHITEYALKNIFKKIKSMKGDDLNNRQKEYILIMEDYFKSNQDLHEQIGNRITEKVMDSIIENFPQNKYSDNKFTDQQIFKVMVTEITSAILQEKHQLFSDIHRIIDGTLDGDRLDYVSRDPLNSGLHVGIIEYDRIISSMRLIKYKSNFLFSPSSKVIDSIEDFFNRRWKMYKQIIYHHRVIKTDYLLQDSIEKLAFDYLNNFEEGEDKQKGENNILPYNISGLWKAIEYQSSHQAFFDRLIQWDDGWLMTIMKKHYFEKYGNNNNEDLITFYELEEILANKKNYFSLIKRMEDFILIDKQVASVMLDEYDSITKLVAEISSIRIDPLIKYINKLGDNISKYYKEELCVPKEGFVLHKIKKIYSNLFEDEWLDNIITSCVTNLKDKKEYHIKDAIVRVKTIKTGIQGGKTGIEGGVGFYNIKDEKLDVKSFIDLSNIGSILSTEADYIPFFYIYVLKNNNSDNIDVTMIKNDLGKMIGKQIVYNIKQRLKDLKDIKRK